MFNCTEGTTTILVNNVLHYAHTTIPVNNVLHYAHTTILVNNVLHYAHTTILVNNVHYARWNMSAFYVKQTCCRAL